MLEPLTNRTTKCFKNEPWCRNDALFKQGQRSMGRKTIKRPSNQNIIANLSPITQFLPWTLMHKLFIICIYTFMVWNRYILLVFYKTLVKLWSTFQSRRNICVGVIFPSWGQMKGEGSSNQALTLQWMAWSLEQALFFFGRRTSR